MADYYRSQKIRESLQKWFAYLFLTLGSIVMLAPLVWTLSTSLKEEGSTQTLPPEWLPRVILRVAVDGDIFQVMEHKKRGEKYILLSREREGYRVRRVTSPLETGFFDYLNSLEDIPLDKVVEQSRSGRNYVIVQEYDRKTVDEFEMTVKTRILSVKSLDSLELGKEKVISPDQLTYLKLIWFRWRNYLEAWKTVPFGIMYKNSLLVSFIVTIGVLLTSSLAAYSFSRIEWPGRDKVFLLYLGTMMIPFPVIVIPLFIIIKHLGWLDTLTALIVPGLFNAYGVFLLRQFFLGIPKELEEAAIIDGCNKFQIYCRIILPLSGAALATLATFTFIGVYNDFMGPLIYLKSESKMTLPVGLSYFQTQYGSQWSLMMAASMIVLLPMILIFLFNQRFFIRGIVMTGLKG